MEGQIEFSFKIEERTFPAEEVIYVEETLLHQEMRNAYKSFMRLGVHAYEHQGKMTGPCYFRYIGETEEDITLQVCLCIEGELPESEHVKYANVSGHSGKFAVGTCVGAYDDLPKAYAMMKEEFKAQGLELTGAPMVERFLNYRPSMPKNELITELIWSVK